MAKINNSNVVDVKNKKAAVKELSTAARNTITDFVGNALAIQYGDIYLAEVLSGKSKKKSLYVTINDMQVQIQFTVKEEPVEINDDNLIATYTAE